jgi:hypothetical protein
MKDFIKYFLLTIIILFALSLAKQKYSEAMIESKPEIKIIGNSIFDFGVLKEQENAIHYFKFRNIGENELVIKNITTTCGCTVLNWNEEAISKNQIDSIKVSYDTNKIGEFNRSIIISSNSKKEKVELIIKGNVLSKS